MKLTAGFYLLFTTLAAAAPLPSIDTFKSEKIELPALTLANSSPTAESYLKSMTNPRVGPVGVLPHFSKGSPRAERYGRRSSSVINAMPVLRPDPAINFKLTVKAADPMVDPKMLYPVAPESESPALAEK